MNSDRKLQDKDMVARSREPAPALGHPGVTLEVTDLQAHDATLGHAAVAALERDTGLPHAKLRVDVDAGWILMTGEVDCQAQKLSVSVAIGRLAGLRGFTNAVEVRQDVDGPAEQR